MTSPKARLTVVSADNGRLTPEAFHRLWTELGRGIAEMAVQPRQDDERQGRQGVAMEPLLVGLDDAGRLLGISRDGVERLITAGELPSRRIGNRRLVHVDDLRAFAAALPVDCPIGAEGR